jgi:xanthine dehydrogenase accessory factor
MCGWYRSASKIRRIRMVSVEEEIVNALSESVPVTLATVVQRAGSVPRAVGAKMVLRPNGGFVGTIGGGSTEAQVMKEARQVMNQGEPKILHFKHTGKTVGEAGSICGGNVTIFVEPLPTGRPDLKEIYQAVVRIKKRGGHSLLATVVSVNGTQFSGEKSKILIDESGGSIGSLLDDQTIIEKLRPEIDRVLREDRAEIVTVQGDKETVEVLLEPIFSDPTVFIFGCGHISACLAPMVKTLGFRVVVTDDRPEFANRERFPDADEIVVEPFEGLLEKLKINENSYLVLVTRGHLHDRTVLLQAVRTDATYIGMIGSRRKVKMLFDDLREQGFSEDLIKGVHAPIGLRIGAETPEEIAVSILAELIHVRSGKS